MRFDPDTRHRRSIRLRGYDYSQAGVYWVTICCRARQCLLGEVVDGEMHLNDVGRMVHRNWEALPERFPAVDLDHFVVMPNHIHATIVLVEPSVGARFIAPRPPGPTISGAMNWGAMNCAPTLGQIIRVFKAVTTRQIRLSGRDDFGWQRNYYEHIIRNEAELDSIRRYIVDNPAQWALDEENPCNLGQPHP